MKWVGLIAVIVLVVACFLPWIYIDSIATTVTGVDPKGTFFGKPGYFHLILAVCFTVFTFLQKIWAKRLNLAVAAINMAWAVRNFILLSACAAGECPQKLTGIYLVFFSSLLLLLASFFPDMEIPSNEKKSS